MNNGQDGPLFHYGATAELRGKVARIALTDLDEVALLTELGRELEFPDYYGHNWNAVDECIQDLSWLGEELVTIVNDGTPTRLPGPSLRNYVEVLADAVAYWDVKQSKRLRVVFPRVLKGAIDRILTGSGG